MPKALETIESMISIKPKEKKVQHFDDKENAPQEQQSSLAKDRIMRQIKPPQKYAYAISLVESIENEEPHTYHEAITIR